jgi:Protein of unknown function (DUF2459)
VTRRIACLSGQGLGLRAGAVLLAAALLGACGAVAASAAALSDSGPRGADTPGEAQVAASLPIVMYLARRHWHIDVGFSVRELDPSLAVIARRFPRAKYLFFGFGDRHYLLSKRKGSSTLSGALVPGPGIILVTALENSPAQAFGAAHVLEFDLSAAAMAAAQSFVRRTLSGERGAAELTPVADGPYEGSLYYGAEPRYSALHTCNTWAAETLNSAGLPVRTRLVLLAGQLWRQARKLAARDTASSRLTLLEGVLAPGYAQNRQSQGGGLPF